MKRLLVFLLTIAMLLSLAACTGGGDTAADSDENEKETVAEKPDVDDETDDEGAEPDGEEDVIDVSHIFADSTDGKKIYYSTDGITTDGSYVYYYRSSYDTPELDGYYRVSCSGGAPELICGKIKSEEAWINDGHNMLLHGGYIYATGIGPEANHIYRINIETGEYEFIYSAERPREGTYGPIKFFPGIEDITDMIIVDDTLYFACIAYRINDDYATVEIGYMDLNSISEPTFVSILKDPNPLWDAYYMVTDYENIYLYSIESCGMDVFSLATKEVVEKSSYTFNYSYDSIIPGLNGFGYVSERLEGEYDYLFVTMEYGELFEESESFVTGTEICPVDESLYEEKLKGNDKLILGNNCFVVEEYQLIVYKDMDFTNPQTLVEGLGRWVCYGNTIYSVKWNESGEGKVIIVDSDANVTTYTIG